MSRDVDMAWRHDLQQHGVLTHTLHITFKKPLDSFRFMACTCTCLTTLQRKKTDNPRSVTMDEECRDFADKLHREARAEWARSYINFDLLVSKVVELVELSRAAESDAVFQAKRVIFQGLQNLLNFRCDV
jgi:hypothetical protein